MEKIGPIGVFDSGIGGLTVARSIKDHFPNQRLIYFGDTAHLPYGEKSAQAIQNFSEKICEFLLAQGCNLIIVACNSASSSAIDQINEVCKGKAMVLNVIDPMIEFVHQEYSGKKVGLIGTHRTVESGEYERKLRDLGSNVELLSVATPLLVPMIEEGYYQNRISHEIIENYMSAPELSNISALILACTHYPLISDEIREVTKDRFEVLSSPNIISKKLKSVLEEIGQETKSLEKNKFYVSDFTPSFEHSTIKFFGKEVHLSLMNLWN